MATHSLARHVVGPLNPSATVESWITGTTNCPLWSPIVLSAAGSGEDYPRVSTTTTAADPLVHGVVVGPLYDAGNLYAAAAAGDVVQVCTEGLCKCKVNGNSDNIAIGDALVTSTTAGRAILATMDVGAAFNQAELQGIFQEALAVFATAHKASTQDGDIIPVYVRSTRGTCT